MRAALASPASPIVALKWTMNADGEWVQQLFERDSRGDRNVVAAPLNLRNKDDADARR